MTRFIYSKVPIDLPNDCWRKAIVSGHLNPADSQDYGEVVCAFSDDYAPTDEQGAVMAKALEDAEHPKQERAQRLVTILMGAHKDEYEPWAEEVMLLYLKRLGFLNVQIQWGVSHWMNATSTYRLDPADQVQIHGVTDPCEEVAIRYAIGRGAMGYDEALGAEHRQ